MNDQSRRHQSWDDFQLLITAGHPAIVTIPGTPTTSLFVDVNESRIGIRMDSSTNVPLSPLLEIAIVGTSFQGRQVLEVSTQNPALYREFYDFACSIADRAQLRNRTPAVAVTEALEAWGDLLQRVALLGPERELGLLGELWMLRRLAMASTYRQSIAAWRGSDAEEHDFGLTHIDIEVKTTSSERRVHSISSLSQLVPSPNRRLYLLSVQLTRNTVASDGWTLPEIIREIREHILPDTDTHNALDAKLRKAGWVDALAAHYSRRFVLRSRPRLIPVDDNCPAITPDLLAHLGVARAARVQSVRYDIDVAGLGVDDETAAFLRIVTGAEIPNA